MALPKQSRADERRILRRKESKSLWPSPKKWHTEKLWSETQKKGEASRGYVYRGARKSERRDGERESERTKRRAKIEAPRWLAGPPPLWLRCRGSQTFVADNMAPRVCGGRLDSNAPPRPCAASWSSSHQRDVSRAGCCALCRIYTSSLLYTYTPFVCT